MKYYLVIVAESQSQNLQSALLDKITTYLKSKNIVIETSKELAKCEAYELLIDNIIDKNIFLREISIAFQGYKLDFFAINQDDYGPKKMLIADMDSTIIQNECIDEIARAIGKYDEIAKITDNAMSGKVKFEHSLLARVKALKSVSIEQLEEIYVQQIKLSPGARILGKTMAKYNCHTILASGGFTFFTSKIRQLISFKEDYANKLQFVDNKLDGYVELPVFGSESKLEIMLKIAAQRKIKTDQIIAVGDGANDLPMLSAIELGIAYKAKWKVKEEITNQINHSDLTSLLYVQGIGKQDFELA